MTSTSGSDGALREVARVRGGSREQHHWGEMRIETLGLSRADFTANAYLLAGAGSRLRDFQLLTAAEKRGNLAASSAHGLHGRKRETAALTAMHKRMALRCVKGSLRRAAKGRSPPLTQLRGNRCETAMQFSCHDKTSAPDCRGFRPPFTPAIKLT